MHFIPSLYQGSVTILAITAVQVADPCSSSSLFTSAFSTFWAACTMKLYLFCTCAWIIALSTSHSLTLNNYCGDVITIDALYGTPCVKLSANATCSDLQSVLLLMVEHNSSSSLSGNTSLPCTELRVSPGDYVLTEAVKIDNHNVVIKAAQPTVTVYFNLTDEYNTGDAVLSIHNCDFVEITGVYFHNSPGVISLDNIPQVILNTTTFRYT